MGVILSCPDRSSSKRGSSSTSARLLALDPTVDLPTVRETLNAIVAVCRGDAETGPLGEMPQRNRFHFLVSPAQHDHPDVTDAHRTDVRSGRDAGRADAESWCSRPAKCGIASGQD